MKKSGLGFLPPGAFPTTDLGPSGPARTQPAVESKIYDSPSILPSHPFSLDWHPAISGNRPDGSGAVPIPRLLVAENLFLRQQLAFYGERKIKPHFMSDAARFPLLFWSRWFDWKNALVVVKPATLI